MWWLWVILVLVCILLIHTLNCLYWWIRYVEMPSTMVFQRKGFFCREILYLCIFYSRHEDNKYKSNVVLKLVKKPRQIAVITGAKRGIGHELTKILMRSGMNVVMGVRDVEGTKHIAESLINEIPTGTLDVLQLDVSSMKSVKLFADEVKSKYPQIHILVNNAGICFGPHRISVDGNELQFATNYLGHYYLTHLLLPCIKKAGDNMENSARVVNVSSVAHFASGICFDDVNQRRGYADSIGYAQSKLAQVMFTRTLDRLFERERINARSFSVHPGLVATDMALTGATEDAKQFIKSTYKSPYEGAVCVAYCCLSPDIEKKGGMYSSCCREGWSSCYSKNYTHQERLFQLSANMVAIDPNKFGKEPEEE